MDELNELFENKLVINKHNLGQYFTTNIELKEKLFSFIQNKPKLILEPSIGQGDLVLYVQSKKKIKFDMFEIDETIELLDGINKKNIIYGDFLNQKIDKLYKTIIGNPPYVKTKKGNLYIDFIIKCYNLLEDNGELIFIIPSDFLKLTSASNILNIMMDNGTFTHIYHPNNEKLFDNATIDVIIFRYCKNNILKKKVLYNDKLLFINNSNGLITFNENEIIDEVLIKDFFDIYVGVVSGNEEVYKNNELGNIEILNAKNKIDKYIFIDKYPSDNKKINEHLLKYKDVLQSRGIRKFNDKNWFEFGLPRNIEVMKKNKDKECIYINTLSRKSEIAFIDKVQIFGGGLLMMLPKKEYDLKKIINYLNHDKFKNNFNFAGRYKIGHRALSYSNIPNELFL